MFQSHTQRYSDGCEGHDSLLLAPDRCQRYCKVLPCSVASTLSVLLVDLIEAGGSQWTADNIRTAQVLEATFHYPALPGCARKADKGIALTMALEGTSLSFLCG